MAIGTDVQAYDADLTTLGAGGAGARSFLGLAIGTDVQAFDSIHTAFAALTTSGFVVRAGSTTLTTRTLTGTTNEIDIAAGSGSTGAPVFSLPTALTFTGKTITGGTFNSASITSGTITAGTWTSGTISTLASPLQVAYGGTSATTSTGALANLGVPYDVAFNAGFSSTGGGANLVVQTYGELISGRAVTVTGEQGYMGTAGTTANVTVDIEVNGTTIYSAKPHYGTTNALTAGTLSNTTIAAGDRITFKVTQIGSTGTPGQSLRFTLLSKLRV